MRLGIEQEQRKQQKELRLKEQKEKSDREIELLFSTVAEPVEGGSGTQEVRDSSDSSDDSDSDSSDSEWEDLPDQNKEMLDGSKSGYNTVKLKYFSMEADRYKLSDRAAAKIGNGLLKDLGIVQKGHTQKLLCPSKVKRERKRWGKQLEEENRGLSLPKGLYSDGKRIDTLVRDTVTTKVQIRGRRGKSAYKEVTTTSNKVERQEHFVVVSEPGNRYLTHITPDPGTGVAISKELVAVVREKDIKLEVLGMDGTPVNTGIHNGVFRLLELELGYPVQHVVCLLHLNELHLRHYFIKIDGTTSGPGSLICISLPLC